MRFSKEGARRFLQNRSFQKQYALSHKHLRESISKNHESLAVVVHLFYVENWPLFSEKLQLLQHNGIAFDLFLTIPPENEPFMEEVAKLFPQRKYMVVPNRGRDILPFVKTVEILQESGYEYLLKFHSKKSTHWEGGQDWLTHTMNVLIPKKKELAAQLMATLQEKKTGIIGPAEYYFPLTINFPANGPHMTRVMTKLYDAEKAYEVLQVNRRSYGFFGGSMFWARLDAIQKLIASSSIRHFETERGQIDATYAHALERLFCVVPEVDGKNIYELTEKTCKQRPSESKNIPEWSTDHDK